MSARRLAAIAALWIGCAPGTAEPTQSVEIDAGPPRDTARPPAVGDAIDLGGLVERTGAAFHRDGDSWRSARRIYDVEVDHAAIRIRAHHRLDGEPIARVSAPLVLGAPSIERGGVLGTVDGASERDEGGALEIERGVAIERLESGARGLEQSFAFPERPPGEGDLVIRIPVSGMELARADDLGLHFRDRSSDLGVVYGHGTWIDARGVRAPVPARAVAGSIELSVSAETLERSAFPALLDPTIGPELEFGVLTYVAAGSDQSMPRAASASSSGSLVVWVDRRRAGTDVFGARFTSSGVVLDRTGIPIATDDGASDATDVAAGAGAYLVVWSSSREIRAVPVSAAGDVGTPILVATGADLGAPRVAFDGASFVIAWAVGATGTRDLQAARVSTAGTLLDTPRTIVTGSGDQDAPAIACNAGACLIAYRDTALDAGDVLAVRLDASLATIGAPFPIARAADVQDSPAVAQAGAGWVAVWRDTRPTGGTIRSIGVDAAGAVGSTESLLTTSNASTPSAVRGGARSFASWRDLDSGAVHVRELAASGAPIGLAVSPGNGGSPALAWDGAQVIAVWQTSSLSPDVYASRVMAAWGSVLDPGGVLVSTAGNAQGVPRAAWGGSDWLVVWSELTGATATDTDVWGARIGGDGTIRDAIGFVVASSDEQSLGGVASTGSGTGWVVATTARSRWGSVIRGDIEARTVSPAGSVGWSVRTLDTPYAYNARIAASADRYLVTWTAGGELQFARLDAAGAILDAPRLVTTAGTQISSTEVTSDGSRFGVVWHHDVSSDEIWAATISAAGTVSPAGGARIAGPSVFVRDPEIAGGGGTFLVSWRHAESTNTARLDALRLGTTGAPIGPAFSISGDGYAHRPAIAWDGTSYLAAWSHAPSGFQETDVMAARIAADGAALDGTGTRIVAAAPSETVGDVAPDGRGRALLVYVGYASEAGARRVVARIIDTTRSGTTPVGGSCTSAWSCTTGFCVDGVCCDSACGGGARGDCSVCAAALGASADGACGPATLGTACRGRAGGCDVAEACDGVSLACPTDVFVATGTLCGSVATGPCDLDDRCTGTSAPCPTSARVPSGTECRASAGGCDPAEACDGTSSQCPVDLLATAGSVCRASAGACDVEETCDGASAACGADVVVTRGTTCRGSRGACDVREFCDGSSAACPADAVRPADTVCRESIGACDVAESCDGRSDLCPRDRVLAPGVVCRPSAGACDLDEQCEGSTECPDEVVLPRGTICRSATDPCDVAEACDGVTAGCALDLARVDGASCSDGLTCNGEELCSDGACVAGSAPLCPAEGQVCVEVLGECAVPRTVGGCGCSAGATSPTPAAALVGLILVCLGRRRYRTLTARARRLAFAAAVGLSVVGCVCGPHEASCGGQCVALASDDANCGACGAVCPPATICDDGECRGLRVTGRTCASPSECDDRDPCNGVETCVEGGCRAGVPIVCDDGIRCTESTCLREAGGCVAIPSPSLCAAGLRCTGGGTDGCEP